MDKNLKKDAKKSTDKVSAKMEKGTEKAKKPMDNMKHDGKVKASETKEIKSKTDKRK